VVARTRARSWPNTYTVELAKFRDMLTTNPERLAEDALKARHREAVLAHIDQELACCERKMPELIEQEEYDQNAGEAAAHLPGARTLDKILRYETALDRQLYRAIHELERLQRRRMGKIVPPPISMEVSH